MNTPSFDWLAFSGAQTDQPAINVSTNNNNDGNGSGGIGNGNVLTSELSGLSISGANKAPLSLDVTQLSDEEGKTYMRWYNDLTIRKHTNLINLNDVFDFLKNFKLSDKLKQYLGTLFKMTEHLSIGHFFALLRLVSHYVYNLIEKKQDILPDASLVLKSCIVPRPKSILSSGKSKLENDVESTENIDSTNDSSINDNKSAPSNPFDLDTFAKLLMTGERPSANKNSSSINKNTKRKKKIKRVKFSDDLITVAGASDSGNLNGGDGKPLVVQPAIANTAPSSGNRNSLDLSLPMDQLLAKIKSNPTEKHQIPVKNISEEEVKEEQDVLGANFKHFQNVNIESALRHGSTAVIPQELVPTNTGGQMEPQMSSGSFEEPQQLQPLQPTLTGSANYFIKKNNNFAVNANGGGFHAPEYANNLGNNGMNSMNSNMGNNLNNSGLNTLGNTLNNNSLNSLNSTMNNNLNNTMNNNLSNNLSVPGTYSPNYISPQPSGQPQFAQNGRYMSPPFGSSTNLGDQFINLLNSETSPTATSQFGNFQTNVANNNSNSFPGTGNNFTGYNQMLAPTLPSRSRSNSNTVYGNNGAQMPALPPKIPLSTQPQLAQPQPQNQAYAYYQSQPQQQPPQAQMVGNMYGQNTYQYGAPGVIGVNGNQQQDDLEWFERE